MIEARGLTKRYGGKLAVDGLSFTVRPGAVTGFLGPNGAGKPNIGLRHFFVPRGVDCRLVNQGPIGLAERGQDASRRPYVLCTRSGARPHCVAHA
jgi:ABC-type lipopolysaccharide export system ATPase subunit